MLHYSNKSGNHTHIPRFHVVMCEDCDECPEAVYLGSSQVNITDDNDKPHVRSIMLSLDQFSALTYWASLLSKSSISDDVSFFQQGVAVLFDNNKNMYHISLLDSLESHVYLTLEQLLLLTTKLEQVFCFQKKEETSDYL
jgi:hypothetical protein